MTRSIEMRGKHPFYLLLAMAASIVSTVFIVNGGHDSQSGQMASRSSTQNCLNESEGSSALATLSFGKYGEQHQAVAFLKDSAGRSTACRGQVITRLMAAMDQPNLDLTAGTPQFFLWHYGTEILVQLKAVEALDLLVANIQLHDGSGFPFNHYPALGALIDLGELALPKLHSVLRDHPDRFTRRLAVFCIALIGGQSADAILKQAMVSESDPCAASCIRATLNEFKNKRRPHNISDIGRTKWYTTFLCDGQ